MHKFIIESLSNITWNVVSAFIIFCLSQLWYFNTKKPLKYYFKLFNRGENADLNKTAKYYKIGSKPGDIQVIDYFKKQHKVGIGWREIGDLTVYIDNDDAYIRQMIKNKINDLGKTNNYYADLSTGYINQIAGYFVKMLSIKPGDIIAVPAEGKVNIFRATSSYQYKAGFARNLAPHIISVENVVLDINLSFLNSTPSFKTAIQNRLAVISLDKYADQMKSLIE